VVVRAGELHAQRGSGSYIARGRSQPLGAPLPASARRGAFSALVGLKRAA
jgi:dihydropyrimidinase